MAEIPNFEQMALTVGNAIGATGGTAVAPIASALRDVWNARGAADVEQIPEPEEGLKVTHFAYRVRRAIKDLNQ